MTRKDIHRLLTPDPERAPRFVRADIPLFPEFPAPGAVETTKFHIVSDSRSASANMPRKSTIIERGTRNRVVGVIVFET
jgi:hypothetical protein